VFHAANNLSNRARFIVEAAAGRCARKQFWHFRGENMPEQPGSSPSSTFPPRPV